MSRRTLAAAAAVLALGAAVVAFFVLRDGPADEPAATTTTTIPTTTEPDTGPVAPLTGLRIPAEDGWRLERPALAAKVDNHPDALPQWGLALADVVIELRVEGISRFLAVWHSQDVGEVGPIRSARTSDPDLLAMLGRPLTAWSGANEGTSSQMDSIPWIQDVSADRLRDAYRRESSRRAPHNLVLDAAVAFDAAADPVQVPTPLFSYRADDEAPQGDPVAGITVGVGMSRSQYVWDEPRAGWLRWSDGEPLFAAEPGEPVADDAVQVAPSNVVVLETAYERSDADPRSPEAVTLGEGRAWVFSAGRRIEGRWVRSERTAAWNLTTVDGAPIRLTPGPTWVALTATGDEPLVLTPAEAEQRRL